MRILIAGGSGTVGRALVHALSPSHQICVLGRDRALLQKLFAPSTLCCNWSDLPLMDPFQFDAIINLCGSKITDRRWSSSVKQELLDSRIEPIRALAKWLIPSGAKPHLICASAIGIYDTQSPCNEYTRLGHPESFLAQICSDWEHSLDQITSSGVPVTITRLGVVLQSHSGFLKQLSWMFRLGLGAVIGSGQQPFSWIHIQDLVRAMQFLLEHPHFTGPVNLVAPHPVTQEAFARTWAQQLRRPLWLRLPVCLIRFALGQMGEEVLLNGQSAHPRRLLDEGFVFSYPYLKDALADLT